MCRQLLRVCWERRWKAIYGQRWQVESFFSRLKRRLGSSIRARKRHRIDQEVGLRMLTMNMINLLETPVQTNTVYQWNA
jgi:transposase